MKYIFGFLFLFFLSDVGAQQYQIAAISAGAVVKNGDRMLGTWDVIDLNDTLITENRNTVLKLVNAEKGTLYMSFIDGQKISRAPRRKDHSELFESTVGVFLEKMKLHKSTLGIKTADLFDWFKYFGDLTQDSPKHRILIIEGEKIPLQSSSLPLTSNVALYSVVYLDKDSVVRKLSNINDSLTLERTAFGFTGKPGAFFKWKLKLGFSEMGQLKFSDISDTIISFIIEPIDVKNIIKVLMADKSDMISEKEIDERIDDFFLSNYGKCNQMEMEKLVKEVREK
jgi:hypothetical protein